MGGILNKTVTTMLTVMLEQLSKSVTMLGVVGVC